VKLIIQFLLEDELGFITNLAREIEVAYQAEVDRSEYLECLLQKVKKLAREPPPQADSQLHSQS